MLRATDSLQPGSDITWPLGRRAVPRYMWFLMHGGGARTTGRRGAWGALASVVLLVAARSLAQAPPTASSPVKLEWIAPAGCPDAASVERLIARLLAGGPAQEARLDARAEVFRTGDGGWHEELTTRSGETRGQRAFDAVSCDVLGDATALALALAIDPSSVARNGAAIGSASSTPPPVASSAAPSAPASSAAPPAASSAPPRASASAAPPPSPPPQAAPSAGSATQVPPDFRAPFPRGELAVAALAEGDVGSLPSIAGGVGAGVAWLPGREPGQGRLRLDLGALYLPPQTVSLAGALPRGGKFSFLAFDARACLQLLHVPVELGPCVGAEVTSLYAAGSGVTKSLSATPLYFAPTFGAVLGVRLGQDWVLRLDFALVAPYARPSFVVQGVGAGTVFQPAAVSARSAVGIELRF